MDCYYRALKQAIHPGSIVVDLGTGTGIMAMIACQFGASRVYAIDYDDSIVIAKQLAEANGYADKIEFIQSDSREVNLPRKADVLVSDLRGVLPLEGRHLPTLIDARQRLLHKKGCLIPIRDIVYGAVVDAPEIYERYMVPWGENDFGLDLNIARQFLVNSWVKARTTGKQLLTEPAELFQLDYCNIEGADVSGKAVFTVKHSGIGHGLSVWFDAVIAEGLAFSNAPTAPELGYSMGFFPWEEPVSLEVGDRVTFSIEARLVGDNYIWAWGTAIRRADAELTTFSQSTFYATPLSPQRLHAQQIDQ